MPSTVQKHRTRAFVHQQGRCCYCGLPIWQTDAEQFARTYELRRTALPLLQCTAEHLVARQDGGAHAGNIAAACRYCNQQRHQRKRPPDPARFQHYVQKQMQAKKWHAPRLSAAILRTRQRPCLLVTAG